MIKTEDNEVMIDRDLYEMRVLGLQHKDVQDFLKKEDKDCKRWNNYAKRWAQV